MNKSVIMFLSAIIVIPAIVFSLAFCFSKALKSDVSVLTSLLDETDGIITADSDNQDDIFKNLNAFNKRWEKSSERWCFFLDHESIHQVDIMTAEFESEILNGRYASALITSAAIKQALKTMSEYDTLKISNLF